MPFCSQCGSQVAGDDAHCARCGAAQPVAGPPPVTGSNFLDALTPRNASILCYIPGIGWIASIIVLSAARFRRDQVVRFHAFQGLYLFVAFLVNSIAVRPFDHAIGPISHISGIIEAALITASIFMIVKVSQGSTFSLPIFGELAARSAAEQ